MPPLQSIPLLPRDVVDLFEAVGYTDAQELSESDTHELLNELVKANSILDIIPDSPTPERLGDWMKVVNDALGVEAGEADASDGSVVATIADQADSARQSLEIDQPSGQVSSISSELEREGSEVVAESASPEVVNFESDPEVISMLEMSPEAEPISAELIKSNQLSVRDIAEGILLSSCQGEVKMNVMTQRGVDQSQREAEDWKREALRSSRIRSFQEAATEEHHVKPLDKGKSKEVVSASEGLNAGLTPKSKRFVRGVLHPNPGRVRVSAFFAVLVQVMLLVAFLGIPSLIICDWVYDVPEVMWWILGIVISLILSAICYLFWGISARCRVCGQRQFAPKKCLKNRKAHHIPLIGYILPTALHSLFYKWFYCIYCGTAVRLKK